MVPEGDPAEYRTLIDAGAGATQEEEEEEEQKPVSQRENSEGQSYRGLYLDEEPHLHPSTCKAILEDHDHTPSCRTRMQDGLEDTVKKAKANYDKFSCSCSCKNYCYGQ